jgi:hypothetical protein
MNLRSGSGRNDADDADDSGDAFNNNHRTRSGLISRMRFQFKYKTDAFNKHIDQSEAAPLVFTLHAFPILCHSLITLKSTLCMNGSVLTITQCIRWGMITGIPRAEIIPVLSTPYKAELPVWKCC